MPHQLSLIISLTIISFALCKELDLGIWDDVFRMRTEEEWKNLWHSEKHRRCYKELENHMRWVCIKDIYRIRKRSINSDQSEGNDQHQSIFIGPEKAFNLFNPTMSLKRQKRGIIDECCHGPVGCSWEEYAEYCVHSTRIRA